MNDEIKRDDEVCADCGGTSDEMMAEGRKVYCLDCAARRLGIDPVTWAAP